MNYRKVGGLHFLRIGRVQLSWCLAGEAGYPVLPYRCNNEMHEKPHNRRDQASDRS